MNILIEPLEKGSVWEDPELPGRHCLPTAVKPLNCVCSQVSARIQHSK